MTLLYVGGVVGPRTGSIRTMASGLAGYVVLRSNPGRRASGGFLRAPAPVSIDLRSAIGYLGHSIRARPPNPVPKRTPKRLAGAFPRKRAGRRRLAPR